MATGWHRLILCLDVFRGEGKYPIAAYSEFMPPPGLGRKPYGDGTPDPFLFDPADPFGWQVTEFEEELEMRPGRGPGRPPGAREAGPACWTGTRTPGCLSLPPGGEPLLAAGAGRGGQSCRRSGA